MPDPFTAARHSLAAFSTLIYPPYQIAPHLVYLMQVLESQAPRIAISLPPQHGKTKLVSQLFPPWVLGRSPAMRIIFATYGQELSLDSGRIVRDIVTGDTFRRIFPDLALRGEPATHRIETSAGGYYLASSRDGPVTGRGAGLLILDDMLKDEAEARSDAITRDLHSRYEHVFRSRLSANGRIILIGTRWGERDLTGYVLREHKDENWLVLNLPAIAEGDEYYPDGRRFRRAGEALWPEQFPLETLLERKRDCGSGSWSCLYQGQPLPEGGLVFNVKNFNRLDMGAVRFRRTVFALDTAFKTGRTNDYSVILVAGEVEQGYPIAHVWRARVDFPTLRRTLQSLAAQWHPNTILVEDAASGQSLIQDLKQTSLPIVPVKVDADKLTRANAITGLLESGRILLPVEAGWLTDFLDEVAAFPGGAHDDQVDALTMALNYLRGGVDQRAWFRAVAASQGRSETDICEIERRLPGARGDRREEPPPVDDDKEELV